MHAHLLGAQDDALGELGLHEDLAAGQGDPALRRAEDPAIAGDAREELGVGNGGAILHEESVGVVTVEAAQRTPVEEDGHAGSRAVNSSDELPRVNGTQGSFAHAAQALGALQVRQLLQALDAGADGTGLGGLEILLTERGESEGLRHDSFFAVVWARWQWWERGLVPSEA